MVYKDVTSHQSHGHALRSRFIVYTYRGQSLLPSRFKARRRRSRRRVAGNDAVGYH